MKSKLILLSLLSLFLLSQAVLTARAQTLTRPLSPGDRGEEVTLLQKVLNSLGATIAPSPDPGSPGRETSLYGSLTASAVRALQCEQGIICQGTPQTTGWGRVGPKTLSLLNSLFQSISNVFSSVSPRSQLAQVSASLSNGLVAHYTFDEGTGTTAGDSSGNNNTGTLLPAANPPTWTTDSKVGSGAMQFDGVDDFVNAGDINAIDGASALTVSAWVKLKDPEITGNKFIFGKWNNGVGGPFACFWSRGNAAYGCYFYASSLVFASTGNILTSVGTSWHHVVGVYNGVDNRMYFDGVQTGTPQALTGNLISNTDTVRIGTTDSNDGYFPGSIDDIRIYNRALSATEIQELYSLGSGGGTPTNQPPTASFSATPQNGQAPLTVSFDASASQDSDGSISSYSWNFGDSASFSNTATSQTTSHTYTSAGTYTATLTVIDNQGATANTTKTITVTSPGETLNLAPVIAPISNQTITLPSTASLTTTATDDGLPTGSTLSYQWTKQSGPGTVTFSSPTSPNTTALFSQSGTYILRLSVSDSLLTATKDVTITVNPQITQDTTPPTVTNTTVSSFPPNTTQTFLTITTNEFATCKYGTTANTSYANLPNTFTNTNNTLHSTTVSNLENGRTYTYYTRCQDTAGNPNTQDTTISFQVRNPIVTNAQVIGSEALQEFPTSALYSGIANFRPGDGETVDINPPRFSWRYKPQVSPSAFLCYNFVCSAWAPYKFVFQVADNPSFTNPIVNVTTLSNSYNFLAPLPTNKTYYWRVGYILPKNLTKNDVSDAVLDANASDHYTNSPNYASTVSIHWTLKDDSWASSPWAWSATRSFFVPNSAVSWDRSMLASRTEMSAALDQHPNILINESTRNDLYTWISGGSGDANITSSWNYMKIAAQAAIASSWWTGRTATSLNAVEIGKTLLVSQLASSPRANVVERALANQIIASNPGAVVASMARDYINKGSQNGGVCRDIVADYNLVNVLNDLAYAYDWFYNDPAAMSDADQVTIRKAIESSLKTVMYQGGIVYNTYDGVSERCDTSDPETAYPDGKTVGGSSILLGGDSHGLVHMYSRIPSALACYADSDICKQFWELVGNFMIGITYPFSPDGAPNAGSGYSLNHLATNASGGVVRNYMIATLALPDAHFELNPFWKDTIKYWDKFLPVGLLTWGDQWTDYGGGDTGSVTVQGGGWLARYTKDTVYATHVRNDVARFTNSASMAMDENGYGDGRNFDYIPLQFAFPKPTGTANTSDLHTVFNTDGYALGCSAQQSTPNCFKNGVGYIIEAKPRGLGVGGHAAYSDLSYDIWAYGTTITAGSGTSESTQTDVAWLYHPMQRNSILVNGFGEMTARIPTHPYYNRIFACRGAEGCAPSDGNYVYIAVDGTNGYPIAPDYETAYGSHFAGNANALTAPYYANSPLAGLQKVRRHFLFVKNKYFVIYDDLQSTRPMTFSWLYHILKPGFDINTYLNPDLSVFNLDEADASFTYKSNTKKVFKDFQAYSKSLTGLYKNFWRGGNQFTWTDPSAPPDVKVFVKQIQDPSTLTIDNRMYDDRQRNPFTGEDFNNDQNGFRYGTAAYLPAGQDLRTSALWFNTKEKQEKYHFMTVIYPQNPADKTAGKPDPKIERIDDYTARVTNPDGTVDVISFNNNPEATLVVDLENMIPLPVPDGEYGTTGGGCTTNCGPTTYALSVTKQGAGQGTVTGGSINCGSSCSQSGISSGASVTLTAAPSQGSTFTSWGGACSGASLTCTVSMTSAKSVTATFTLSGGTAPDTTPPTVTLTAPLANASVSGTVPLSATASDPSFSSQTTSGIAGVQFKMDGVNIDLELNTPNPGTSIYAGNWNTAGVSNDSHTLTAVARDIAGNTRTSTPITVTVSNAVNRPPVLASIGAKSVNENSSLSFTVSGSDPDNDTLSYTAATLPLGAVFTPATRTFSWTPSFTQSGAFPLTFTVSDNRGGTDSETVSITVTNVNRPPTVNAGNNQSITLPATATLSGTATDDEPALIISWTRVSGSPSAVISNASILNPTLTFTTPGNYVFRLTASDGTLSASDDISITVSPAVITLTDTDNDGIPDVSDKCPDTPGALRSFVNRVGCPKPRMDSFTTRPNLDDVDLNSVSSLELGAAHGKLSYLHPRAVSLVSTARLDFDSYLLITKNKISVNTANLPLFAEEATTTITLYDITFRTPKILKDGNACPATVCANLSYDSVAKTLSFTVSGFSTYEVVEGYVAPEPPQPPTGSPSTSSGPSSSSGGRTRPHTGTLTPTVPQNPTINCPTGYSCAAQTQATITYAFTRSLSLGSTGPDVKALQQILNAKGFTVSTAGPGSRGNETLYFGPATQSAVIRFQISKGITPAVGFFGPITRGRVGE
ncbi:MAG: hypothetical protein A3B11_02110 [Candidatus Taylorbacteria bacterium RIFCSPLOWO2_01_FULL_44_26]|uniref:Uncharacterized protein n=1 Tax=Candidatus Taylorbacteria bacterium RIFCSPLOWO2_01_FULL_44_26 TaxID=1802318 RepID=A0A1G2N647_9BACT|nr:MAG: hypothetical protein A3B11_02110 [Candidatus Taylorbacteria bacterium RIFCSPLOWO2_01_FULL_44_26]